LVRVIKVCIENKATVMSKVGNIEYGAVPVAHKLSSPAEHSAGM